MLLVSYAAGGLVEVLFAIIRKEEINEGFLVTGFIFPLILPPGIPLWMLALGVSFGVLIGKEIFGGTGRNLFNPALVGRAVLQATFPVPMTTWVVPFAADRFARLPSSTLAAPFLQPLYDAASSATPLSAWKFGHQATGTRELALGLVGGSTGETSAVLLLAGAAYLVARNMMGWRTPAAIFAAVAALSGALHLANPERYASPAFMLFAGGLMLGALFMATDMVTSPITHVRYSITDSRFVFQTASRNFNFLIQPPFTVRYATPRR